MICKLLIFFINESPIFHTKQIFVFKNTQNELLLCCSYKCDSHLINTLYICESLIHAKNGKFLFFSPLFSFSISLIEININLLISENFHSNKFYENPTVIPYRLFNSSFCIPIYHLCYYLANKWFLNEILWKLFVQIKSVDDDVF